MKILCLADEENKAYWDYFRKEKLDDIDLILSCGDLKADYLTFLVTMGHAPLLYIHGNHDEGYRTRPPEGCDCIDDKVVTFRGLRIVGLGGCLRYRPGEYQYSEADMQRRIRRMSWKLRKGVDIVVAHAPVQGFGDLEDLPHRGFACFRKLIENTCRNIFCTGMSTPATAMECARSTITAARISSMSARPIFWRSRTMPCRGRRAENSPQAGWSSAPTVRDASGGSSPQAPYLLWCSTTRSILNMENVRESRQR